MAAALSCPTEPARRPALRSMPADIRDAPFTIFLKNRIPLMEIGLHTADDGDN